MRVIRLLFRELKDWVEYLIAYTPGQIGIFFRRLYYSYRLACPAPALRIELGVQIGAPSHVTIGKDAYFGSFSKMFACPASSIRIGNNFSANSNVMINARGPGGIEIGDNVLIGPNVVIRSNNHVFSDYDMPIADQGMAKGFIVIEDDVWIAANAVILPNVRVGRGSIVGAGAVVTSDVCPFSIVAGVPARLIGSRNKFRKNEGIYFG